MSIAHIAGYALRWGDVARTGNHFERFAPGAFDECLSNKHWEIDLDWRHNREIILASTSDYSLRVWQDEWGVGFGAEIAERAGRLRSELIVDEFERLGRCGMSFSFIPVDSVWETAGHDERIEVNRRAFLTRLSPTSDPAYRAGGFTVSPSLECRRRQLARIESNEILQPLNIDAELRKEDFRLAAKGIASNPTRTERRTLTRDLELGDRFLWDDLPTISGHAAVFDKLSDPLGPPSARFRERISPGAFTDTIRSDDIRALWNHNPDLVLGRVKSSTLSLKQDAHGLAIEIDPPNTTYARDLCRAIERGDIDQMSFAVEALDEGWSLENGETVRTLKRIKLFEVSPVTFPAYPQTDVGLSG